MSAEPLLSFLGRASSYAHKPSAVRTMETHISWVFLAAPFVFKVKKPVALGFLDFSTLEKRRQVCTREVELNRRLCPEVYLGVVPIYFDGREFSFEAKGTVNEYAVQMRELPDGFFLHQLLAQGAVGATQLDRVIARLRRFYESETPTAAIEAWGQPEKLRISTDENFTQIEPFVGRTISPAAFEAIRAFTNNFYTAQASLFAERVRARRIRDCHGDLHLDHVHLTPEAVTIFDCIEFNDRFRYIDVANDLAFLAMDFDFERAHQLGALFLRRAADALQDPGLLELADFYKCYRAVVRGKVESLQANSDEHAQSARRYFQLALRYATVGSEPIVLVVMGRIATGKSTIARELARELDWPVFSSDAIRKKLAGVPLTQRTPRALRAEVYAEPMTERTYANLLGEGLGALDTHSGVVLDATFSKRARREMLRQACRKADVRCQVIELEAGASEIARRLEARAGQSGEISDARLEDLQKLAAAYEPPTEWPDRIQIASTAEATLQRVLLHLAKQLKLRGSSTQTR